MLANLDPNQFALLLGAMSGITLLLIVAAFVGGNSKSAAAALTISPAACGSSASALGVVKQ